MKYSMVQFKQSALAAFSLLASSPVGVVSFAPSSNTSFRTSSQLEATRNNNNNNNSFENKLVGGATAFVTGLVIATQVAFADASTLVENSVVSPQSEGKKELFSWSVVALPNRLCLCFCFETYPNPLSTFSAFFVFSLLSNVGLKILSFFGEKHVEIKHYWK